jgi:methyl-accepting chemotaxis protein
MANIFKKITDKGIKMFSKLEHGANNMFHKGKDMVHNISQSVATAGRKVGNTLEKVGNSAEKIASKITPSLEGFVVAGGHPELVGAISNLPSQIKRGIQNVGKFSKSIGSTAQRISNMTSQPKKQINGLGDIHDQLVKRGGGDISQDDGPA